MALLFAERNKKFLLWWTLGNVLFLANNLLAFPRNLDGHLLSALFGHHVLWTYPQIVGPHGPILIYALLIIVFGALVYQAFRITQSTPETLTTETPLTWYTVPFVFYLAALCAQHVLSVSPVLIR